MNVTVSDSVSVTVLGSSVVVVYNVVDGLRVLVLVVVPVNVEDVTSS